MLQTNSQAARVAAQAAIDSNTAPRVAMYFSPMAPPPTAPAQPSVSLPIADAAKHNVLTPEEYDVRTTFKPKSAPHQTWIHRLSTNEYVALCVSALVVPFVLASGASVALRKYSARKYAKAAVRDARAYLSRAATFDPRWIARLTPPNPATLGLPVDKAFENEFPFIFDANNLPNGIPKDAWKNPDSKAIGEAMRRAQSMSDIEVRYFSLIYRNFSHAPAEYEVITKTMQWVLTGKATPEDLRRGVLPRAAVNSLAEDARAEFLRGAPVSGGVTGAGAVGLMSSAESAAPFIDEVNAMKLRQVTGTPAAEAVEVDEAALSAKVDGAMAKGEAVAAKATAGKGKNSGKK